MRHSPSLDGLFFIGIRLVDPFEQLNGLFAAKAGSILSKLIFLPFLYIGQVVMAWLEINCLGYIPDFHLLFVVVGRLRIAEYLNKLRYIAMCYI